MVGITQPDAIEEVALSIILYLLLLLRPALVLLSEFFILLGKKLRGVLQVVLSPLNFFLQLTNFPLVRSYRLVHLPLHTRSEDLTPLDPGDQLFLTLHPYCEFPLYVLKLFTKLLLFCLAFIRKKKKKKEKKRKGEVKHTSLL
ncbi:hypothetical protein ACOSP7_014278 [Xanthoceras sorbifolium]